jgi:hypothetical protein
MASRKSWLELSIRGKVLDSLQTKSFTFSFLVRDSVNQRYLLQLLQDRKRVLGDGRETLVGEDS